MHVQAGWKYLPTYMSSPSTFFRVFPGFLPLPPTHVEGPKRSFKIRAKIEPFLLYLRGEERGPVDICFPGFTVLMCTLV